MHPLFLIHLYVFMIWYLAMQRDNFIFIFKDFIQHFQSTITFLLDSSSVE